MLRLEGLSKRFGETVAVSDLSLEVQQGEFLSLLGPSGCGKTTTLRMVGGFESPSAGRIRLGERDVTTVPPRQRGVGMVFQSYALFPHLDVYENVAFGLRSQGVRRAESRERVARALERVDLAGYERRAVQALSGGQQQRVALARALAPEPPLLLLDEPLSNLDAALRERTREELRALLKRVGITAVFVTHDQEEAFDLSDRIALLRAGELQQVGTPEELYRMPANSFVASFVGRANFLDGTLLEVEGSSGTCELPGGAVWPVRVGAGAAGRVRVMVRPESLRLSSGATAEEGAAIPGTLVGRRFAGAVTIYRVEIAGGGTVIVALEGEAAMPGDGVRVSLARGAVAHAFPRAGGVIPSVPAP